MKSVKIVSENEVAVWQMAYELTIFFMVTDVYKVLRLKEKFILSIKLPEVLFHLSFIQRTECPGSLSAPVSLPIVALPLKMNV